MKPYGSKTNPYGTMDKKYVGIISKKMNLNPKLIKDLFLSYTEYEIDNFQKFVSENHDRYIQIHDLQRAFLKGLCDDKKLSFPLMYKFVNWFQYCVRSNYFENDNSYKDTFSSSEDFRTVNIFH